MMKNDKKPFHVEVSEKLIKQLKQGTAPWQKPWNAAKPNNFLPINPTTGKRYRGINTLVLMSQGREDQRWMTYKQAVAAGAQVRKGEKGSSIQYWKVSEQKNKVDENGVPVKDADGKQVKVTVRLERPRMFMATVFNAEQIDGLPPHKVEKPSWSASDRAEKILQASSVTVKHIEGDRACYRASNDTIQLPNKAQFSSSDNYYATALHELGHSTGHETRLGRDLSHPFGSEGYAKEELRAEIASMILGDELGIGHDPGQHAAYVGSWIKVLEKDPKEIFRAAVDAEKIQEFVLGLEQKQEIKQKVAVDIDVAQQVNESALPDLASITQKNNQRVRQLTEQLPQNEQHTIALLAEALKFHRNGSIDNLEFEGVAQDKLGFKIPADWNGDVVVDGSALDTSKDDDGYTVSAEQLGVKPEFWSVYVQRDSQDYELVEDFKDARQADAVAKKLSLIDAVATKDEETKAEKITRIEERMVLTNEDIQRNDFFNETYGMDYKEYKMLERNGEAPQPLPNYPDEMPTSDHDLTPTNEEKQYLAVPYAEKEQAKKIGARWDKTVKLWYVGENADINQLKRWMPDNSSTQQQGPAITPIAEFAEALRSLGCVVTNDQSVKMDGQKQRIKVEGDKPGEHGEKSGFYVGHQDGHPAGYIKNNRTGEVLKWKAKGYSFTGEQKAKLYADAAIKRQARKAKQHTQHLNVSQAISKLLAIAPIADEKHPYLQDKQARPGNLKVVPDNTDQLPEGSIIKIGKDWNEAKSLREEHPDHIVLTAGDLLLAAQDMNDQVWTAQSIQGGGSKFFVADGKKEGNFHIAGSSDGMASLRQAPAIVIAEGYATADTLSDVLGYPTVAAFDAGNLSKVATQLHDQFPDKIIVIAGDDDLKLESEPVNKNVGKEKALDAADAVNGIAIFPTFAPKEQVEKGLSDFNDLASKSVLGRDGVKRQVEPIIAMKIKTHKLEHTQVPVLKTQKKHTASR